MFRACRATTQSTVSTCTEQIPFEIVVSASERVDALPNRRHFLSEARKGITQGTVYVEQIEHVAGRRDRCVQPQRRERRSRRLQS